MKGTAPADEISAPPEARSGRLNVSALRRAVALRMWGGNGCGSACDFCRVTLASSDVEYEVEAQLDGKTIMLHFHPRCHDAWRAGQAPAYSSTPQGSSDAA